MIVVRAELWSLGSEARVRGTVIIDRIEGTGAKRNYRCRAYRRGDDRNGIRAMLRDCKPFRVGTVRDYPANAENIWNLVGLAMAAMGFRTDGKPAATGDLFESSGTG